MGKQKPIEEGVSTDSSRVIGLSAVEVEDRKKISEKWENPEGGRRGEIQKPTWGQRGLRIAEGAKETEKEKARKR